MSYQIDQPPAVKKAKDTFTITAALLSLALLIIGVIVFTYTDLVTIGYFLVILSVLGVLSVGLRLAGLRKHVVDEDLDGVQTEEEARR